jgi:chromosome segregation ATPase
VSDDLLDALLRTALADEALDERTLPRFAEALRARAARILAERIQPIEERAAAFEKESGWRAEIVAGLEKEKAYLEGARDLLRAENARRDEQIGSLKAEREALIAESGRLVEELAARRAEIDQLLAERQARIGEVDRLKEEVEALRTEGRTTADAHDRLAEHHRATAGRLAEALESLPAELPWSYKRVRQRLLELALILRKEAR